MLLPGKLGEMLEQAQRNFSGMQADLEKKTVEASVGGGMVRVTATGGLSIASVIIDKTVVNAADVEMLQDLVQSAVNEALRKAKEMMKEEMVKAAGGLGGVP